MEVVLGVESSEQWELYAAEDNEVVPKDNQRQLRPVGIFGHLIKKISCKVRRPTGAQPTFVQLDTKFCFDIVFSWKVILVKLRVNHISEG